SRVILSSGLLVGGGGMSTKRVVVLVVALCCFFALTPSAIFGQTAGSGLVKGTVYDKTGALVPKASVELAGPLTGFKSTQITDSAGQFTFVSVPPGTYKLTVSKEGFRTQSITALEVQITKSAEVNVTLEVGQKAEVVEVRAGIAVELQTLDASVGN